MKTKILITVEGGIVQSVCANNPDIEIVIIDYDDESEEPTLVSPINKPDLVVAGKMYEIFSDDNNLHKSEKIARDELKRMDY